MKTTKKDLEWAVEQDIISSEQADALWTAWEKRDADKPRFDFAHVAYYIGALIVIIAMALFLTLAWEDVGGWGIFLISTAYLVTFAAVGSYLWYRKSMKVPGGLLVTIAVCMVPLVIYGLQRATGFWLQGDPGIYQDFYVWIRGSWFIMELGTVIAGLIALKYIRFPFLTAPIAVALWYMSMDIAPLIYGVTFTYEDRINVSIYFGLAMLIASYLIDHRFGEDFSFWGYLFGLFAFWGGISSKGLYGDAGSGIFLYFLLNVFLILISIFLERRVFVIFGGIGVMYYLSYLAYDVFQDSLLFPIALSLIGVLVIVVGILYQKHVTSISNKVASLLPPRLRWLRPRERVHSPL
jgi:hypothetical protein